VAHPNDIQINPYIKNHMQFLRKNYPSMILNKSPSKYLIDFVERWTVTMLAESFNQSVANVRLILQQRTTRGMRVRPRPPSSLFGIKDEEERERLIREHIIKRDLPNSHKPELQEDDGAPVNCQVLAEESHLLARRRPSDAYLEKDVRLRNIRYRV
jgi:hypothetical protein